jgi:hypothetical protein
VARVGFLDGADLVEVIWTLTLSAGKPAAKVMCLSTAEVRKIPVEHPMRQRRAEVGNVLPMARPLDQYCSVPLRFLRGGPRVALEHV